MKMRRVLSFLVCLFSLWTWKDFFLRWLWSPASHLPSPEEQPKSELARFLSSLPEDERQCNYLNFDGDSEVRIGFGERDSFCKLFHSTGVGASYREFLEAVASSEIVSREGVFIFLHGDDSCQHVEAFADALRQSGNGFSRYLNLVCYGGSAVRLAKCVRSLLLGNDAIEDLKLEFGFLSGEMVKDEDAEFYAIITGSHHFQTLKSFDMWVPSGTKEGIEQLLELFKGPSSRLENLKLYALKSDTQVEHIGGMLASNTSLKTLSINEFEDEFNLTFPRGYTNIGTALCSNQSLEALQCRISSSLELKALLDPLMPKTNNPQRNTTLTKLHLTGSIGGKEGIQTLVDMICTNSSLLELHLMDVEDLSSRNVEGIDNVLAI